MIKIILTSFVLLALCACRTKQEAAQASSLTIDSIARSAQYRTFEQLDTFAHFINLDFDTLEIQFSESSATPNEPPVIRLKAIKGSLKEQHNAHKQQTEVYNHLDTTAYHQHAAGSSTEHTTTTRLFNPTTTTMLFPIALIVTLIAIILYFRKRN